MKLVSCLFISIFVVITIIFYFLSVFMNKKYKIIKYKF